MTQLERIKLNVEELYKNQTVIHLTITLSHPKINLQNGEVIIKGIYPHVFRVEEVGAEMPKSYTLQYTDLLTNRVQISEII